MYELYIYDGYIWQDDDVSCYVGAGWACGWCGPTQTCMNGTKTGPDTPSNQKCYGEAWFYKNANPCPNCEAQPNCKSCLFWSVDCFWCETIQMCKEWGTFVGCPNKPATCRTERYSCPIFLSLRRLRHLLAMYYRSWLLLVWQQPNLPER